MYSSRSGLILGFHGCDLTVVQKVVSETQQLKDSKNDYDWLGHGAYFWEHSPSRALAYAEDLQKRPRKEKLKPFDSVKGVFWEGAPLYPTAGFREKDHIQICIRNPNCIKGYFIPRLPSKGFDLV